MIPLLILLCYIRYMTKEPTIQDVLDAMHVFSTHVDVQLADLKQDVSGLKEDVSGLKQDVSVLKQDVSVLKQDVFVLKQNVTGLKDDSLSLKQQMVKLTSRVDLIQATMVTKDYMEGCLAALAR